MHAWSSYLDKELEDYNVPVFCGVVGSKSKGISAASFHSLRKQDG